MARENIKQLIMKRDNLTDQEADELILEAQQKIWELIAEGKNEEAYEIPTEMFGLEPDYLDDLI